MNILYVISAPQRSRPKLIPWSIICQSSCGSIEHRIEVCKLMIVSSLQTVASVAGKRSARATYLTGAEFSKSAPVEEKCLNYLHSERCDGRLPEGVAGLSFRSLLDPRSEGYRAELGQRGSAVGSGREECEHGSGAEHQR